MQEGGTPFASGSTGQQQGPGLRFRVVHLLYVIAVVASSLATLGTGGIVPVIVITGFWTAVFNSRSRPKAFRIALVVLLLFGCLSFCLLLPAVETAREAARRMQCNNNLRNICLGLQNYHDTYSQFPPAYIPDENGKPMHSWRVLILPYIEHRNLYEKYRFDEPWDGPNNRKLLSRMPDTYACPAEVGRRGAARNTTSYVAVVDARTAWPGPNSSTFDEIVRADGTSNTINVVEANGLEIPWMKPDDVDLEDAVRVLSLADAETAGGHRWEDFFYFYSTGCNVAMADGSVHFLQGGITSDDLRGLLRIDDGNGGNEIPAPSNRKQFKQAKLGNWFRLTLFLLIAVFPTPWVWWNPTSGRATHEPNPIKAIPTNEANAG